MKQILSFTVHIGMFLITILLYACSTDELQINHDELTTTLRISSVATGLLEATTGTNTRASTIILNKETDTIGVFLLADPANGYPETIINRAYTYGTPMWKPETELTLQDEAARMIAVYPYKESQNSTDVRLNSGVYNLANEYYYQNFKASFINTSVALSLKRAYSLLRFVIIKGEKEASTGKGEYTGDGSVSELSFTANICAEGTLDLTNETVSGNTANFTLRTDFGGTSVTAVKASELAGSLRPPYADFMLVPCTPGGDITFLVTIDGKQKSAKLPIADLLGTTGRIDAGVKYEIQIVIRPTSLDVIKELTTEDWTGGDTSVEGDYVIQ